MKKTVLIGMTAIALTLGACGKKTPPAEVPPPTSELPANPPGTATDDSVDLVELRFVRAEINRIRASLGDEIGLHRR